MKLAVSELNVRDMPDGKTLFFMSIEVSDVEQLDLLTSRLKKNSDVYDVTRIMAGGEE
jgi:(p)ppGpp synthase/HD superfamily hydrolase